MKPADGDTLQNYWEDWCCSHGDGTHEGDGAKVEVFVVLPHVTLVGLIGLLAGDGKKKTVGVSRPF